MRVHHSNLLLLLIMSVSHKNFNRSLSRDALLVTAPKYSWVPVLAYEDKCQRCLGF